MSHSDSELPSPKSRERLSVSKPKHLLSFLDQTEPKESKKKDELKSHKKRERFGEQNMISFSIQLPTRSSKRSPLFKDKLDIDDVDDSDDSDCSWYPPQHPKGKDIFRKLQEKNKKMEKKKKQRKPKEERWSYWHKQLPDDIEYCDEEIKYFMKQSQEKRKEFIEEETSLTKIDHLRPPPRFKFLSMSTLDPSIRHSVIQKIDQWYAMEPGQSEFNKLGNWVKGVEKIPFGSFAPSIRDIMKQKDMSIVAYLRMVKQTMDNAVYGHEEAKEQILELLAKQYVSPHSSSGFCIGIQGPAGNGKTTLIKEGIGKALDRPFCLIGLGGAKNSDSFVGHDYTYEGGTCGRILQALQIAGVMNPIIYFDELDKLSEDSKGEEIANLLCHLTDPSQNTTFEDKFFSGIPIDLSNVMFIFSFNDESKLNPILKDRIHIIRTQGMQTKQKIKIVRDYIIPEIIRELPGLSLEWSDSIIEHIISNFTQKEKGVRNLKRAMFTLYRKTNLHSILASSSTPDTKPISLFTKPILAVTSKSSGEGEDGGATEATGGGGDGGSSSEGEDKSVEVTKEMVEEYLRTESSKHSGPSHMYI